MCGIAGCYQQPDGQKLTDIMNDRIAHRGPDATRIYNYEDDRVSVQLGHRRLSIIDLSEAANQPISKAGLTIIYNGELYNYKALRADLAARGVSFPPIRTPRWCSRPGGCGGRTRCRSSAACSRSRCSTSAAAS